MKKMTELKQIKRKNNREELYNFFMSILNNPNTPDGYYGADLEYLFNFSGKSIGIIAIFKLGYIQAMQDYKVLQKGKRGK